MRTGNVAFSDEPALLQWQRPARIRNRGCTQLSLGRLLAESCKWGISPPKCTFTTLFLAFYSRRSSLSLASGVGIRARAALIYARAAPSPSIRSPAPLAAVFPLGVGRRTLTVRRCRSATVITWLVTPVIRWTARRASVSPMKATLAEAGVASVRGRRCERVPMDASSSSQSVTVRCRRLISAKSISPNRTVAIGWDVCGRMVHANRPLARRIRQRAAARAATISPVLGCPTSVLPIVQIRRSLLVLSSRPLIAPRSTAATCPRAVARAAAVVSAVLARAARLRWFRVPLTVRPAATRLPAIAPR
jgi:hypothetical protein